MANKKPKASDRIALRLQPDELRALDLIIARMTLERPGSRVTRSEAVRAAVLAFAAEK